MTITVLCPNGHRLNADNNNAGKTGRCPVCKATVSIPLRRTDYLSETAILSILGTPPQKNNASNIADDLGEFAAMTGKKTLLHTHVKLCPSCDREIDTGYHICPHCQTYISTLSDF